MIVKPRQEAKKHKGKVMKYQVVLDQSEEGYAVSVPSLPGCHSQGSTEQEALENIADAILEYLLAMQNLNCALH